ncbi:amino acid adenylation domain-containing protein [Nocardia sp. NPDC051990]|uniref:amino acid adenylation domain-containing protein n=1 Tax=Nocardia sp. NPDC051990 TaxID=3155285 RepID=UPI0034179223
MNEPATLVSLFEAQVARTPEAIALVQAETALTYRELDSRAAVLADELIRRGAGPEEVVAVAVPRSPELVVALLGVLKTGAAYLPIDPSYPPERLAFMLTDAVPVVVVTNRITAAMLPETIAPLLPIDDPALETRTGTGNPAATDRRTALRPDHPAYLIYTSGSTGRPKGVAVTHRAIVNRLVWMQSTYGIDAADAVLQKTSSSFDVSVWEFFWPLQTGARLVLADPQGHGDPAHLSDLIEAQAITVVHFVPSMLAAFLGQIDRARLTSLRYVFTSGEGLPADSARRLRASTAAAIHNLYGPTEAAVDVTFHEIGDDLPEQGLVPIGLPVANTRVYVLDERLRPVPVGVVGELYLAGVQLARGYRGRPGLTASRFVVDPFDTGGRLYRTGDLVRSRPTGVLEFVARSDDQVKIRGFRVEPGEIEAVLAAYSTVAGAVVIARESATGVGKQLIGYVTGDRVDADALRRFAGTRLPEYMVPAAIVVLDEFPLSLNGKLDRRALPEPRFAPAGDYQTPRTEREQIFAALFADVLRLPRVGADDSFFALGGDSISAIQVVSRARRARLLITPQDVLIHRTPVALAAVAGDIVEATRARDLDDVGVGPVAATPIVEWLRERGGGTEGFCQVMMVSTPPGLRLAEANSLLRALIDHHDVLRMRIVGDTEGWSLAVRSVESVPVAGIERIDCSDKSVDQTEQLIADRYASAGHGLGPASDSMVRAVWFDAGPERAGTVVLAIHHLAVDGVSWRILLSDLAIGWNAIRAGAPIELPVPGTSFRRWSTVLAAEAVSPSRVAELPVWRGIVADTESVLGRGEFDPSRDTYGRAGHLTLTLPVAQTAPLLGAVPAAFHAGVQDILLAAFAIAMIEWAARRGRGRVPVVVDVEGHGRDETIADGIDLSRTVGWFTSMYPVRLDPGPIDWTDVLVGDAVLAARVKGVKEQLRAIPGGGLGFGLLRYLNRETRAELSGGRRSEVGFNYLGRISSARHGAPWGPAGGYGTLLDSAAATMPLPHALELNAVTHDDAGGPRLVATWTWAEALLTEDEIGELGRLWFAALGAMVTCAERTGGGRTPSDLALVSLTQQQIDRLEAEYPGLEDVLPITPVQEGMLYHALYAERVHDPYVVQVLVDLQGSVDTARLRASLEAMIDRHPGLRARFVHSRLDQPVQVITRQAGLSWGQLDLTGADEVAGDEALAADRLRGFALATEPLFRATLIRLSPNRIRLSLTHHHIVCDGWSIPVLLRELFDIYLAGGKADRLPPVTPYRAFFEWRSTRDRTAAEAVWRDVLAGVTGPTLLAPMATGAKTAVERDVVECAVPQALTSAVIGTARRHGTTLGIVLQVAWGILLARTTGRDDVIFGTPVSGRPAELPGIESMVGPFINTVPVRMRLRPAMPMSELLNRVQRDQIRLLDHQHVGLSDIHRWTRHPELFDTLFVVQNYPEDPRDVNCPADDISVTGVQMNDTTHYPLEISVLPGPSLTLRTGFQTDVFDRETVDSLISQWQRVLEVMAADIFDSQNLAAPEQVETDRLDDLR